MKHRLSTIWMLFLVLAVVLGGVTGCSRSAAVRDVPIADAAEAEDTEARSAELEPLDDVVVSAVSAEPDTEEQPVPPVVTTDIPVVIIPTPAVEQEAASEAATEPPAPPPTEEPPAEEPSSTSGSDFTWHTVKRGENLGGIALLYGTTVNAIVRANNIANPNIIIPGQRLKIPKSGSSGGSTSSGCRYRHTVKVGEWIWQIGRVYGVSGNAILQANGLSRSAGDVIQPGTVLCIP